VTKQFDNKKIKSDRNQLNDLIPKDKLKKINLFIFSHLLTKKG